MHFSIKILNQPFEDCGNSCLVSLIDPTGRQKEKYTLGIVDFKIIHAKIKNGEDIKLDNRYVTDFSLDEYRLASGLPQDTQVELKNFSARRTYFDVDLGVDFSNAKFTGEKCDFSSCIFGDGPCSFYHAIFKNKVVTFEKAHFGSGIANFQFSEFESKSINFDEIGFYSGDLQFINATFGNAKVSFKNAQFGQGNVDFRYSKFGDGVLTFDKSVFAGGNVTFKRVDFGDGKVDFKRVNFGDGDIDFSEADFGPGKVVFRSAIFGSGNTSFEQINSGSEITFDNAEFGTGRLSFFEASAYNLTFQFCRFNSYVDLRVKKIHRLDLSYTIVRDIIDLIPTDRCPVEIDLLNFNGMRNLGNLYIDWRKNKVLKLIMGQEATSDREKSEQFLILKETYNSTGRYSDEDKAYVWYKRLELKADLQHAVKKSPANAFWAYPTAFFKWLLFDKIGLYATEPIRVLFSVSIIYTVFSLLYLVLPLMTNTYIDTTAGDALVGLNPVAKSFYFSAITFLTVGYGDFFPVGIMRVLASLEGYVGVFLMGYFSVAFVRKVLR